jgi:predicted nucleic acid-binding protein
VNKYLLDTNVVSETRKLRPHGSVTQWLGGLEVGGAFLSAVTLGELQAGIEKTRRQDPRKAEEIERWLDLLAAVYEVLPMDGQCFRDWARIMDGKPPDLVEDAMLAATARVHGLIVATSNERDFKQLEVRSFNPFKN